MTPSVSSRATTATITAMSGLDASTPTMIAATMTAMTSATTTILTSVGVLGPT